MNNDIRDQLTRARSILAWRSTHSAAASGPKAVALFVQLEGALTRLVELGADQDQASGTSLAGTAGINSLVEAVHQDLVLISGTARTIRKSGESLDFDFALPKSAAHDVIIEAGEAFYRELSKDGVKEKFLEWEIRPDFLEDLRADLDAYEGKVQGRDNATQERKDAVSDIEAQEEILIGAIDGLDTLFKNKFQGDAKAYRDWREASKLVRTRVRPHKPLAK